MVAAPRLCRPVYDRAHFAAATRELLLRIGDRLDERPRLAIDAAARRSADTLERLGHDPAEGGLIHADLHGGNVVYRGEPRRAGAIDFARCGFGCWALDVAMAQHYLTDDLSDPLLDAYLAAFPLSPDARRALPRLRFLAAVENLAILAAVPDEAEFVVSELAPLATRAERLGR